jgi:hypothetical protein
MKTRLPIILLASCALTFPLGGQEATPAEASGEPEPLSLSATPILWPGGSRPALQAQVEAHYFDGMPVRTLHLTGPGMEVSMQAPRTWKEGERGRRDSLALVNFRNPSHRVSIALFGKQEFIADLSEESVAGYVAGLRETFGAEAITVANDGKHTPYNAPFIFGHPWRYVDFTVETKAGALAVRDYLIHMEEVFVVVRHFGPPEMVKRYQGRLLKELSQSWLRED